MEIELVPERLFFFSSATAPVADAHTVIMATTGNYVYSAYVTDFGPFDLGFTAAFCRDVQATMQASEKAEIPRATVIWCEDTDWERTNAAVLVGCFAAIFLKISTHRVQALFDKIRPALLGFTDASAYGHPYRLSVIDVVEGFVCAIRDRVFSLSRFNPDEYRYYGQMCHGDLNVVLPGKIIAFSSPFDCGHTCEGHTAFRPADYRRVFETLKVELVIRLNEPECYEASGFTNYGIRHLDLCFPDGSNPNRGTIEQFIAAVEGTKGLVAVHCRAGLGRTGTLIGFYLMRHYGWTVRQTVGWLRLCRPGSVIGPQQLYLHTMRESVMRVWSTVDTETAPTMQMSSVISLATVSSDVTPGPSGMVTPPTTISTVVQSLQQTPSHPRKQGMSEAQSSATTPMSITKIASVTKSHTDYACARSDFYGPSSCSESETVTASELGALKIVAKDSGENFNTMSPLELAPVVENIKSTPVARSLFGDRTVPGSRSPAQWKKPSPMLPNALIHADVHHQHSLLHHHPHHQHDTHLSSPPSVHPSNVKLEFVNDTMIVRSSKKHPHVLFAECEPNASSHCRVRKPPSSSIDTSSLSISTLQLSPVDIKDIGTLFTPLADIDNNELSLLTPVPLVATFSG